MRRTGPPQHILSRVMKMKEKGRPEVTVQIARGNEQTAAENREALRRVLEGILRERGEGGAVALDWGLPESREP